MKGWTPAAGEPRAPVRPSRVHGWRRVDARGPRFHATLRVGRAIGRHLCPRHRTVTPAEAIRTTLRYLERASPARAAPPRLFADLCLKDGWGGLRQGDEDRSPRGSERRPRKREEEGVDGFDELVQDPS